MIMMIFGRMVKCNVTVGSHIHAMDGIHWILLNLLALSCIFLKV